MLCNEDAVAAITASGSYFVTRVQEIEAAREANAAAQEAATIEEYQANGLPVSRLVAQEWTNRSGFRVASVSLQDALSAK